MFPAASPKPFLGPAVADGKIRYLSVSAIQKFDRTEPGGCPRAYFYRYVLRMKEQETEALRIGTEVALQLETYLTTGQDVLGTIARAGKFLLPAPGPDLEVEQPLGDIAEALRRADKGDYLGACQVAGLSAGGIPLMGAADCRSFRAEFVDEEGELRADSATVEIIDHKTTSRISDHTTSGGRVYQGYAKTPDQLRKTTQMLGYAIHAIRRTGAEKVRLSHIYYQTKGQPQAEKRTVLIGAEDAKRGWDRIDGIVDEMKSVVRQSDPASVPANLDACRAYGRPCSFSEVCPRTPSQMLVSLATPPKGATKAMNLFNSIKKPTQAPDTSHGPTTNLFATVKAPAAPAPDLEARRAAELARLEAEDLAAGIGAINPPDAPESTLDDAANPLTMEVIAQINDPELKLRAETHAKSAAPKVEKPEKKTAKKAELAPALSEPPHAAATIFLDCAVLGSPQPRPLSEYYDPIVAAILSDAREADLRTSQEGYLSHGKWRGVLSVAIKNRPIPPGEYVASSSDEIEACVVSALRARVVRGVR